MLLKKPLPPKKMTTDGAIRLIVILVAGSVATTFVTLLLARLFT
jgi:hypothetical protein